jgi:exodeoxyribonuclease VII large subunit
MQRSLNQQREKLKGLSRGLPRPAQLLENATQRYDDWSERLIAALPQMIQRKIQALKLAENGLRPALLLKDINQQETRTQELFARLKQAQTRNILRHEERLGALAGLLENMNVQRVLERGFALVRGDDGKLLTKAEDAKNQKTIEIQFADGRIKR